MPNSRNTFGNVITSQMEKLLHDMRQIPDNNFLLLISSSAVQADAKVFQSLWHQAGCDHKPCSQGAGKLFQRRWLGISAAQASKAGSSRRARCSGPLSRLLSLWPSEQVLILKSSDMAPLQSRRNTQRLTVMQACTSHYAVAELHWTECRKWAPQLEAQRVFFANFIFRIVLGLMYQINNWD